MNGGTVPPEPDPDPDPPGPDPPTPTRTVYTYDSTSAIGGHTIYENVRSDGVLNQVITSYHPEYANFTGLIYFATPAMSGDVVLRPAGWYPLNDGGTYETLLFYNYHDGSIWQWDNEDYMTWVKIQPGVTTTSQTPSDYLTVLDSGEFDLEAY